MYNKYYEITNNLKIVKNNFNKSLPSHLKDLNARSKQIFSLIVNDYLKTGDPVGSRKISFKLDEQLSPASNKKCNVRFTRVRFIEIQPYIRR